MSNQSKEQRLRKAYKKALSTSILLNLDVEKLNSFDGLSTTRDAHPLGVT